MGTQLDAGGSPTKTPSFLISPIARSPPNQKAAMSPKSGTRSLAPCVLVFGSIPCALGILANHTTSFLWIEEALGLVGANYAD